MANRPLLHIFIRLDKTPENDGRTERRTYGRTGRSVMAITERLRCERCNYWAIVVVSTFIKRTISKISH